MTDQKKTRQNRECDDDFIGASFTTSTASKTQLPLPTIFKVKQQYHYQQLCACTKTDIITLVWFQQCSLVQSLIIVIIAI